MTRRMLACMCLIALASGAAWAGDGFGDIFQEGGTDAADEAAGVDISGEIALGARYFLDDGWDGEVAVSPRAVLEVAAVSRGLEGRAVFSVETEEDAGAVALQDVVDELYVKAFFGPGYLTAGLFKVEWGKGDGVHVTDPLNPLVQKGAVETDLFKMKRAEAMVMASVYLGKRGLLELVYKPYFHPLQSEAEGRWAAGAPDVPQPDTSTFAYSQGAARLTGTLGPFDLGALYYYGYMSEPGYEISTVFTGGNPFDPANYQTVFTMVLTRAHLLGIEGAAAVGPFTARMELGYWLSEDREGYLPELYNDRLVYLGGIDMLVPGTSMFFSLQLTGRYTLGFPETPETDVDRLASYDGTPHSNTLVGAIEVPFARDTMKIRLSGLYLFEAKGYMAIPEYLWNIKDNLELRIAGEIFGGSETEGSPYYLWDDNDNIGISLTCRF